jgi:hypothetical protein
MIEGLLQPAHILVLFLLVFPTVLCVVLPLWRILVKAGYPGPVSLLAPVPVIGVVVIFWLAFSEWPLERLARQKDPTAVPRYCSACGKPV